MHKCMLLFSINFIGTNIVVLCCLLVVMYNRMLKHVSSRQPPVTCTAKHVFLCSMHLYDFPSALFIYVTTTLISRKKMRHDFD